jgi:hypothetical protein
MYKDKSELMAESHEDLISIANSQFGLGVSKKFKKDQIADLILNAVKRGLVNTDDVEVLRGDREQNAASEELPPGYCVLRLERSPRNPNSRPLPYGIQGKVGLIPVGKTIKAPEHVLEILSNAVHEQIHNDMDQGEEVITKTFTYPFTVISHNRSDKWPQIQRNIERNMETALEVYG